MLPVVEFAHIGDGAQQSDQRPRRDADVAQRPVDRLVS